MTEPEPQPQPLTFVTLREFLSAIIRRERPGVPEWAVREAVNRAASQHSAWPPLTQRRTPEQWRAWALRYGVRSR